MITLHPAKQPDLDFLLDLRMLTMDGYLKGAGVELTWNQHVERVLHRFELGYLIKHEDTPVGMVKYLVNDRAIDVLQFQIHPEWQKKGIGREVLVNLRSQAAEQRKALTLRVLLNNPAIELYQKFGFVIIDKDELEYHLELSTEAILESIRKGD